MRNKGTLIKSNASKMLRLDGGTGLLSASSTDSIPVFDLLAYTGGLVRLDNLPLPVVFDLATTRIPESVPLLFKHNQEIIVGQADNIRIVQPSKITATGRINGTGERAVEIKANAKNGFRWQLSVGLLSNNLVELKANQSMSVNGQTFYGPIFVATQNDLREISFVSIGADSNTFARLVASFKDTQMTFEEWLASLAIDASGFNETETASARRIFDGMRAVSADANATPEAINAAAVSATGSIRMVLAASAARITLPVPTPAVPPVVSPPVPNPVADLRAQQATEFDRINTIRTASEEFGNPVHNGVAIAATAIREGWDIARTRSEMELARFRAQRPAWINAGGANGGGNTGFTVFQLMEAAVAQTGRLNPTALNASYTPQLLDAAHKLYKGRIGLQQILFEAACANGYRGNANFKANGRAILEAAFSTIDLPGFFSNSVNKYMVDGFMGVDQSWRKIASTSSVPDFKEVSGYRGVGAFRFDQLPPDGQIHHGTLQEAGYGNKVDTFAKMFGIPRTAIINDDLGYLSSIPRQLGRGGALALLFAFWTEFLNNSSFFTSGNGNTSTGALSIAGLNAALTKFRKLTDENGDYVMSTPTTLVVPVELEETANQLYTDTFRGGGNTGDANSNPHVRKYEPVVSPYLSDSRFTGYSTTAYYLLADPRDVPVINVAFLDGVETPTVDTADADFAQLGIQMRGYFDFGVRKQEFRGGVRSSGT